MSPDVVVDSPGLIAHFTPERPGRQLRLFISLDTEVDAMHLDSVGTGFAVGLRISDRFEAGLGYRRRLTQGDPAPEALRSTRDLVFFRSGLLLRPRPWLHLYFGGELGVDIRERDGQARFVWSLRFKPTSKIHIALSPASPTYLLPSSERETASNGGWTAVSTLELGVSF